MEDLRGCRGQSAANALSQTAIVVPKLATNRSLSQNFLRFSIIGHQLHERASIAVCSGVRDKGGSGVHPFAPTQGKTVQDPARRDRKTASGLGLTMALKLFADPACLVCSPAFVFRFRALSAGCAYAIVVVSLTGCAGWRDYGDTYVAHRTPKKRAQQETTFRFGLPGGDWRPVRDVDEVQVAWFNPSLDGVGLIELHAQCDDQGDSSLEQYTDHLRIDWDDWSVVEQAEEKLLDRAALRTVVDASLDGISRRNELWVVKKNGCLFDLRYSAGAKGFAAGRQAFAAVIRDFQFPL